MSSPRDRHLTIYGRNPVAEALDDTTVPVARVFVADGATGPVIDRILAAARRRGVPVERTSSDRVAMVARNGRHHQGVAADIAPPGLEPLAPWLARRRGRLHRTAVLLLDGVHNPSNVGMIIRSATAAGIDGVVVPDRRTAELGPLVLKASAGVALAATLLRVDDASTAVTMLREARFTVVGLDGDGDESLFDAPLPERACYVLGNEADGLSVTTDRTLRIPLAGGVESLNVAAAATLLAFEISRRGGTG